jgi:predicted nucleic acid-binding protein
MMPGWRTVVPAGKVSGPMSKGQDWLFDTGCLIDIYRGRNRIRPAFEGILAGEISPFISVVTEAELWRGLRAGELERHQALLAQFRILPLRSDAARLAGSWMQQYQADGLGWMDALITSTAKVNEVAVLTRDRKLTRVLAGEADFALYS